MIPDRNYRLHKKNLKKKIQYRFCGFLVLIDTIMDGSECGSKISLMTKRLPTELVNVKTTDTENLDEKEIVSDIVNTFSCKPN